MAGGASQPDLFEVTRTPYGVSDGPPAIAAMDEAGERLDAWFVADPAARIMRRLGMSSATACRLDAFIKRAARPELGSLFERWELCS